MEPIYINKDILHFIELLENIYNQSYKDLKYKIINDTELNNNKKNT